MRVTFACPLEKEADNKHLKAGHSNHQSRLDHTKIEYPVLGALDRAEIAVFSSPEVLLIPMDCGQRI